MDKVLKEIKKKALDEHIPILMDDTLEEIIKYLKKESPKKLLEIGTAVRILCYMFCFKYG